MENLSTFLLFLKITRLTKTKDDFSYNIHQLSAVYYINKLYLYIYVIFSSQLYIVILFAIPIHVVNAREQS